MTHGDLANDLCACCFHSFLDLQTTIIFYVFRITHEMILWQKEKKIKRMKSLVKNNYTNGLAEKNNSACKPHHHEKINLYVPC